MASVEAQARRASQTRRAYASTLAFPAVYRVPFRCLSGKSSFAVSFFISKMRGAIRPLPTTPIIRSEPRRARRLFQAHAIPKSFHPSRLWSLDDGPSGSAGAGEEGQGAEWTQDGEVGGFPQVESFFSYWESHLPIISVAEAEDRPRK